MTDALKKYKEKRNFAITSEPADDADAAGGEGFSFVIQKHWASRLHYDFRLELDGSMKSWAVPKGPSYDPHDKRMAVQVEDHPIAYSSFEGTIPEKQYGAGKVIIWDKGTWEPLVDPRAGYEAGNLKFQMHGHKMHGKWALIRLKDKGEKQPPWLLIKEKDDFVRPASEFSVVDEMPDSVKEMKEPKREKIAPAAAPATPAVPATSADGPPAGAIEAKLPAHFAPELATLVDQAPGDPHDWVFEIKFDGYRMLTRVENGKVQLITRNDNDWTAKLPGLHAELVRMKLPDGWYDGEIVVHDDEGKPDFGLLQTAFDGSNTAHILYFLFDVPYLHGHDMREVALVDRRAALENVLHNLPSEMVRFSEEFGNDPEELVRAACRMGLEGVIGKRRNSRYIQRRSPDWVKLKCGKRQEFVIGGYTDPQGSRVGIGSLLLGTHDKDGVLQYAGNVGTGFNAKVLQELKEKLSALDTDVSPFPPKAVAGRKHHWVKPKLICEISFAEWTRDGSVRHAVFHGLREDKPATNIIREEAKHVEGKVKKSTSKSAASAAPADPAEPEAPVGKLPADFKVSNGDRVIDAQSGATKLDMVRYYALVGDLMMEQLKDRPVSLVRAPAGVGGELFFQKHADLAKLPGLKHLPQELDPEHPPMLAIGSAAGLLAAAQWNVIEFHSQNAVGKHYDTPDRMVFDLDPGEGVDWKTIQEAAELMRAFLQELGLPAFLKTSGGKGLHVVVPIKPHYDWDTVKDFSQRVVGHMADTLPDRFAFKSGPRNRVGKIFIDYLRNGRGATTAAAWSARTRPGLGISVPIFWEELAKVKGGDQWNIKTVHDRLDEGNTAWADYGKSAVSLTGAMKKLNFDR